MARALLTEAMLTMHSAAVMCVKHFIVVDVVDITISINHFGKFMKLMRHTIYYKYTFMGNSTNPYSS
jgi:hypothetical protein